MRIITKKDLSQYFTMKDFIEYMEEAFLLQKRGEYLQPDRLSFFPANGLYNIMPCFSQKYISNKLLTVFPKNTQEGLPTIQGLLMLADARTGTPLALLDAMYITGARTGAVGAISCKYLTSETVSKAAVIGCGTQGFFQTRALAEVRGITDIYAYSRRPESIEKYAQNLSKTNPSIRIHRCKNAEEAAAQADIILTCTTASQAIFPNEASLFYGKHIVAVGTSEPDKRELPPAAVQLADEIYTDTLFACEESGDLRIPIEEESLPKEKIKEICQIVDLPPKKRPFNATTLFKTVGIGLFDLVASGKIYEKAERNHIGQVVDL